MFLDTPIDKIGQVGGGKTKRNGVIAVAVIQSLHRETEVKAFVAANGHVVVDECHHLSAFTFEQVMRQVKAKFVVGLTADPTREDGNHSILYMQCGQARFTMAARAMTASTWCSKAAWAANNGARETNASAQFRSRNRD